MKNARRRTVNGPNVIKKIRFCYFLKKWNRGFEQVLVSRFPILLATLSGLVLRTQTTVQRCLVPLNLKQSPSSSSNADPTNSNSVLVLTFCFQESVWLQWRHGLLKWKNLQEFFMTTASLLPHVKTWGMGKRGWDEPLVPNIKWLIFSQRIESRGGEN